jgi:hypothetical protein
MASEPLDDVRRAARDSLYVGVGLGLLAFQAAQVRRRELERQLGVPVPPRPTELPRLLGRVTGRR